MKKILKKFPLTSYATVVVLMAFFLIEDKPRDEVMLIDPVLWITILALPLMPMGEFYRFVGLSLSLPWAIPTCLLLDLILFTLFPKLTANQRLKPKQISKK